MSRCIVHATCPTCGDVDINSSELTLTLYPAAPERDYWIFRCPSCLGDVTRHCSEENRAKLMGRVRVEVIDVPAEALEERDHAALTWDDVLDFALELARDVTFGPTWGKGPSTGREDPWFQQGAA
jgi:predicted RNA-binding Zn-ribbon protein involved in translation (DUF1610 family)